MAQSARLELALRILTVLARQPGAFKTSAVLAEELKESPVMIRRVFLPLQKAGILVQRKGPLGGAHLTRAAKSIGLGDIYSAIEPRWLTTDDKALTAALKRTRAEALAALNESTLATLIKRLNKA